MKCARLQRGLVRSLGVALALVTAASPLLDSLHEASVRHVACPDDGELIDAPPESVHEHGRATGNGPSLFGERDSSAPQAADAGHGHCAIALQSHLRAREESPQPLWGAPVELAFQVSQAPEATFRGVAVYRVAPKASPPQA